MQITLLPIQSQLVEISAHTGEIPDVDIADRRRSGDLVPIRAHDHLMPGTGCGRAESRDDLVRLRVD